MQYSCTSKVYFQEVTPAMVACFGSSNDQNKDQRGLAGKHERISQNDMRQQNKIGSAANVCVNNLCNDVQDDETNKITPSILIMKFKTGG